MATKTFKIGLSDADKAAMAQDVYERVIALTFAEYDSSETYNEGDFVVYNDALYKCLADEVTGAWDSTKWQLATLNDLVDDIENAVAFVNDKANVNGNYPTMTVGFADNLTPYDESAGDDQDEPFSFQATGTGNGTQPDFSTGSGALMKEKQGNTVVVNQYVANEGKKFSNNTTDSKEMLNLQIVVYQDNSSISTLLNNNITSLGNKIYLLSIPDNVYGNKLRIKHNGSQSDIDLRNITMEIIANHKLFVFFDLTGNDPTTVGGLTGKDLNVIDLTQWFNDDIPQYILDHPENFFRYYQGSLAYNTGTLVNANGRYIKCIGMNQWDEDWEVGTIDRTTGLPDASSTTSRSKNFCKCLPNTQYYLRVHNHDVMIAWYNANKSFIEASTWSQANRLFTSPTNAEYFKIVFVGTTYNNDISINLYYEDEPRCLTYEPYEVLANNDTGNEVLRSAGSVKDSKAPDGTITRRIGVVDLSQQQSNLSFNAGFNCWILGGTYPRGKYVDVNTKPNIIDNLGTPSVRYYGDKTNALSVADNGYLLIGNGSDTVKPTQTLFYELAEPTTEQGTSYSENLIIDDFGSMDFGGTSGVPQGNLIFYPVDYKAFIDTLYKYTDGTPSNIALKSDVASEQSARESVDTQLKNALGGTLRQCLCIKESLDFENTNFVDISSLAITTWTLSNIKYFVVNSTDFADLKIGNNDAVTKMLCSKYKSVSWDNKVDKTIFTYNDGTVKRLCICDDSYTDATAFKNAMKGVLLAYEKASE